MIFINSQDIRYFYRNIIKSNNVYRIKHKNKDYGEFKKLSDALYERDALFYCNFDYDLLVECDLENRYENMDLPPFPSKRSKGRIKGTKVNKAKREGQILFDHSKKQFYVEREDKIYKYCDTMTEAYYYKKILMENDWDETAITKTVTENIEMNVIIDLNKEYEVKISFCPNCRHKIKYGEQECPYCGFKIEE